MSSMNHSVRSLFRLSSLYAVGNIVVYLLAIVAVSIYTRLLPVSEYGKIAMFNATLQVVMTLALCGLIPSMLRFTKEYGEAATLSSGLVSALISGSVVCILLIYWAPSLSRLVFGTPDYRSLLVVLGFIVVIETLTQPGLSLLRVKERMRLFWSIRIIRTAIQIMVAFLLIWWLKLGVYAVAYAVLFSGLVQLSTTLWVTRRYVTSPSWRLTKILFRYGVFHLFTSLAFWVLAYIDRYFLLRYCGYDVVGIYNLGYKLGSIVNFLYVQPFLQSWNARYLGVSIKGDDLDGWNRFFSNVIEKYTIIGVTIGISLTVWARELVLLVSGEPYLTAVPIIAGITFSLVIFGIHHALQWGIMRAATPIFLPIPIIVATLTNIGLNMLLIPNYGMIGAMSATVVSYIVLTAVGLILTQKRAQYKPKILWRIPMLFIVCYIVFVLTTMWLTPLWERILLWCVYMVTLYLYLATRYGAKGIIQQLKALTYSIFKI